jgi:hypothetical protein
MLQERFQAVFARIRPETLARLRTLFGEHSPYTQAEWKARQAEWDAMPEEERPPHTDCVGSFPLCVDDYLWNLWKQLQWPDEEVSAMWKAWRKAQRYDVGAEDGSVEDLFAQLFKIPRSFVTQLRRALEEAEAA